MKKAIIIGSPGAGKSTFSFALAEKTGLPLYHIDKLFWQAGWISVEKEELDTKLLQIIEKDEWIIDGNYNRTIPMRLEACDTVFFLDYPRLVCFFGVIRRVLGSLGKVRPDMAEGCPERFDWEFLKFVWNFPKKKRAKLLELLESAKAEIHVFHSRKEAKRYLDGIKKV
jgi:adenylate kinase family enzyme